MASRLAISRVLQSSQCCYRAFSSTSHARAVSEFKMPSMSPTMESGKISAWKVKEGDKFSAGDILLTIETDKAEVDVEAQDDGIVGKLLLDEKESSIQVGKTIALLAEEGDDISNLSAPDESTSKPPAPKSEESKASSSSSSTEPKTTSSTSTTHSTSTSSPVSSPQDSHSHSAAPKHSRPLLPSVYRLLMQNGSPDISELKGSGIRGQLTKGDILAFLGQIKDPLASAAKLIPVSEAMDKPKDANKEKFGKSGKAAPQASQKPLSGAEFRRWISAGLAQKSARPHTTPVPLLGFDDILEGYLPKKTSPPIFSSALSTPLPGKRNSWDELLNV